MKKIFDRLQYLFLDWTNNFLTVSKFAAYYGFSEQRAQRVIDIGRAVHERHVKRIKSQ